MANKNKNSSTGKQTQAAEPQPLPTAEPVVLSSALQAAGKLIEQVLDLHSLVTTPANGIEPDGILVDKKIAGKLAARCPPLLPNENSHP
jgi:hypothetical protein